MSKREKQIQRAIDADDSQCSINNLPMAHGLAARLLNRVNQTSGLDSANQMCEGLATEALAWVRENIEKDLRQLLMESVRDDHRHKLRAVLALLDSEAH